MNLLEIAKLHIPREMQRIFFPLIFLGFGVLGALFLFHTWSPDGHASAPTVFYASRWSIDETRRLRMLPCCYVPDA